MNKKKFSFPPEEEMEKVIKRMTQPGYRRINKGLKPDSSFKERKKYNFCKDIVCHATKNNLTEKDLTKQLGIDQEKLEYVLFCHINKLTSKELTNYLNILHINNKLSSFSKLREKNILLILKSYYNKHKWL